MTLADPNLPYALAGGGLLLLFVGGELLLRGSVGLGRFLGFSPLFIGLVVLSTGTSAPEFFVTWRAVAAGQPDIAVGNLIGSNISNILFVLGLGALIRPMPTSPKVVFRDGGALVLASIAFAVLALGGVITQTHAYGLLGGFAAFLILAFALDWRRPSEHSMFVTRAATRSAHIAHPGLAFFAMILGALLLFFGANFLVTGGLALAREAGVSNAALGLVGVAVACSLPELATTIIATARGQTNLAVGNLVGSNIFNLLAVTGAVAAMQPLPVSFMLGHQDAVIMAGAAVMLVPLLNSSWRLNRVEGLLLLSTYGAYLAFLAFRENLLPLAALGLS